MPHQSIVFHGLLKQIPWATFECLVDQHGADKDERAIKSKPHLIALLLGQLCGTRGLREIEANLKSHAGKLHQLGGCTISRSALSTANASRPAAAVFGGLLAVLMKQLQAGYRRKIGDCVRLIDSTSVQLSSLSSNWARFSTGVYGAKAHIIYDPDADQPLYLIVTPSNVNDITAAKQMPIEAGATYVFDLGYYDYAWWAMLDAAGCRIVTRLKANTPFEVVEDRPVPGLSIMSDRIGYLPKRLAAARQNPMSGLVREVQVKIETGKVLRIFTNDLNADAQEIADLYKRRWAIELFFRWVKQTLKIDHFYGTSENAVRIQITVALIAFLLLRLVQDANKIATPLTFARLIRTNLMHRRAIAELLKVPPPPPPDQPGFDFGPAATRAAHRRRNARAMLALEDAA